MDIYKYLQVNKLSIDICQYLQDNKLSIYSCSLAHKAIYYICFNGHNNIAILLIGILKELEKDMFQYGNYIELHNMRSEITRGRMKLGMSSINEPTTNFLNCGLKGACRGNHIITINLMISYGAYDWNMGLEGACEGNVQSICDMMISYGANDWVSACLSALEFNNLNMAKQMINRMKINDCFIPFCKACSTHNYSIMIYIILCTNFNDYIGSLFRHHFYNLVVILIPTFTIEDKLNRSTAIELLNHNAVIESKLSLFLNRYRAKRCSLTEQILEECSVRLYDKNIIRKIVSYIPFRDYE